MSSKAGAGIGCGLFGLGALFLGAYGFSKDTPESHNKAAKMISLAVCSLFIMAILMLITYMADMSYDPKDGTKAIFAIFGYGFILLSAGFVFLAFP